MLVDIGGITMAGGAATAEANLNGGTATDVDFSGTARAGWRFNVDGTVDRNLSGVYTQQGGDQWMTDAMDPAGDFWMRLSDAGVTDDPTTSTGTFGVTWSKISGAGQALVEFENTRNTIGQAFSSVKVEISTDDSGVTVVAIATYDATAEISV